MAWWSAYQTGEGGDSPDGYCVHLSTNRDRLPPDLLATIAVTAPEEKLEVAGHEAVDEQPLVGLYDGLIKAARKGLVVGCVAEDGQA